MNDSERHIIKRDLSLKDDVVITYDNVQALGKFIALLAIKRVMHYHGERGYQLYPVIISVLLIAYIIPHTIPQIIAPQPNLGASSIITNGTKNKLPIKNFNEL